LDLLTTCTHHSEFQIITASSRIATLYKSLQHPLSFPACCVLTSRSLAKVSTNSGDSSTSRAQVVLSQPPVQNSCQFPQLPTANYELNYSAISSQPPLPSLTELPTLSSLSVILSSPGVLPPRGGPNRKHPFLTIPLLLFAYSLPRKRVYPAVA
jgi:hypothetical protein